MCKELLQLAEDGISTGMAFVVKVGRGEHHAGMAGDYRRNPDEAMAATFRLERRLMQGHPPFEESAQ